VTYESFLDRVHPDDRQGVKEAVTRAREKGTAYSIDFRVVLADGTVKTVHEQAEMSRDKVSQAVLMIGTIQDITQRKESEARAQSMITAIESLSECVALYDADDRLVFCNAPYRELNSAVPETMEPGVSFEDHLRAILAKGLVPKAVSREDKWLEQRMKRHRNPEGPIEIMRQEGRWLLNSEKRLEDGGSVLLLTDITDMKQAETDRCKALERAKKANRAKSEFLATMSHELRTPLNAITGFAEIISGQYFGELGNRKYKEYAEDIVASSRHLLDLVNDVLDLSAIEAGRFPLFKEDLDIREIAEECSRSIADIAERKQISYCVGISGDLPPCHADRRGMKQIFLNLLSNAVKFTPEGGKITLHATVGDGCYAIRFTDSGDGIPAEKLARLTDPFTRAEPNVHKSQEGAGLGLSIVDSLLKLHGGEMDIESGPGKGTTVTVKLPAAIH
ncbi:MAG: PAS-domain containing protein, partial [Alphaproteobacteria bacterium]|nr:PAS-domain containing protein [Alphaproteobacteria bacterium]